MDPNPDPQNESSLAVALTAGGFSEQEKVRILHFLGYPRWYALGPSIAFGYPSASEPLYIAEDAFKRLSPDGRNSVRADLCKLERIDCAITDQATQGAIEGTGDVKFNRRLGRAQLLSERARLVSLLADDLGCFPNPYSQTYSAGRRVVNT